MVQIKRSFSEGKKKQLFIFLCQSFNQFCEVAHRPPNMWLIAHRDNEPHWLMDTLSFSVRAHAQRCVKIWLQDQHVRTWHNSRYFDLSCCWRKTRVYVDKRGPPLCADRSLRRTNGIILFACHRAAWKPGYCSRFMWAKSVPTDLFFAWWTTIR